MLGVVLISRSSYGSVTFGPVDRGADSNGASAEIWDNQKSNLATSSSDYGFARTLCWRASLIGFDVF